MPALRKEQRKDCIEQYKQFLVNRMGTFICCCAIAIISSLGIVTCKSKAPVNSIKLVDIKTSQDLYFADSIRGSCLLFGGDTTSSCVGMTVTNISNQLIYYICTGNISRQEISNGKVISESQVNGFERCWTPMSIEPGKSHTWYLPFTNDILEQISAGTFKTYRFKIGLFTDEQTQQALDEENRLSNEAV